MTSPKEAKTPARLQPYQGDICIPESSENRNDNMKVSEHSSFGNRKLVPCESVVIQLNETWAVGFDDLQWIVMEKRMRGDREAWRHHAFVATKKLVLERVIAELGVTPTEGAQRALDQLPESFREWFGGSQTILPDATSSIGRKNGETK